MASVIKLNRSHGAFCKLFSETFLSNMFPRDHYRPQQSWVKVIFSEAYVKNSVHKGGWYPSMPCRWYPSMPCRSQEWYPSMPCRSPGPHPGGSLRGLARGVSRPTPRGEVEGSGLRGSPGPHPGGNLRGLALRGSPGPHLGGVSRLTPSSVSQHALRQTPQPLQLMATGEGGTHPTGMHSCFGDLFSFFPTNHKFFVSTINSHIH